MPIAAIAPIIGGVIGAGGALLASGQQASAANKATDNTKQMFEETKANLQPFTDVGKEATYSLADLYGLATPTNPNGGQAFNQASLDAFTNSPDYQFAQQQGIAGLDASAASKGGLLSGNQLEAITNYSSGLATQNFNNYANRLMGLANQGESAGAGQATASGNAANSIANTTMAAGNAGAGGTAGAFNNLLSGFNQYLAANPNTASGYGSSSAFNSGNGGMNMGMGGLY